MLRTCWLWYLSVFVCVFVASSKIIDSCPELASNVDCSDQGIASVPSTVPEWTEFLDLSRNDIQHLGDAAFSHVPHLQCLYLDSNNLKRIPSLAYLRNLTVLKVRNNSLTELAPLLFDCPNLKTLVLSRNKITTFPSFDQTTSSEPSVLSTLLLDSNKLTSLNGDSFKRFQALQTLNLSRNAIKSLAKEALRHLKALKHLDLSYNKIRLLDGLTFVDLTNLEVLKLGKNRIRELSDGAFWGLSNMKVLQLQFNNITSVDKGWLYGLASLETLILTGNNINEIANRSWEFCSKLLELDLSSNQLRNLDGHMTKVSIQLPSQADLGMRAVERLNLSSNSILSVNPSPTVVFQDLRSLISLDLSDNQLASLVEDTSNAFSALPNLRQLFLRYNNIQTLPKDVFVGLRNLELLDLSGNRISRIQEGALSGLQNLEELILNTTSLLCDCNLRWLKNWLSESDLRATVGSLLCENPQALAGMDIMDVPLQNFTCAEERLQPRFLVQPESHTALKGDNVSFTCISTTKSKTSAFIHWKKDNEFLLERSGMLQLTTTNRQLEDNVAEVMSILTIYNVQPEENSGRFQCIFTTDFGSIYSQRAQLTVHVFPKFIKTPSNLTLSSGSTARLDCSAFGLPTPQIRWQKDGGDDFPAARERRVHIMPTDDVFFIVNVKPYDSGIYTCTAVNAAGSIKANLNVSVLEQPSFQKPMKDKSVRAGQTAVFECLMAGSPKPQINWYVNDEPLSVKARRFLTAEGQILVIVKTRQSDAGVYGCEIHNQIGLQKQSGRLTVIGGDIEDDTFAKKKPDVFDSEDGSLTPSEPSFVWRWFESFGVEGIIIFAVVTCILATSLVWIVIIWRIRRQAALSKRAHSKQIQKQHFLSANSTALSDLDCSSSLKEPFCNTEFRSRSTPATAGSSHFISPGSAWNNSYCRTGGAETVGLVGGIVFDSNRKLSIFEPRNARTLERFPLKPPPSFIGSGKRPAPFDLTADCCDVADSANDNAGSSCSKLVRQPVSRTGSGISGGGGTTVDDEQEQMDEAEENCCASDVWDNTAHDPSINRRSNSSLSTDDSGLHAKNGMP